MAGVIGAASTAAMRRMFRQDRFIVTMLMQQDGAGKAARRRATLISAQAS
jgi:hypothetical protein